jgi:acyl-CoA reductase-like NAD-dependent aldehyde dehydrogenase
MSDNVKIVSPIDGSVYAERALARDAEIESAVTGARAALPAWRSVSVSERARYMLAFLDALLAMNDEIAVELAWQMGRPVRYGGEKGSVEDRVRGMVALAEEALKPYYPPEKPGFSPATPSSSSMPPRPCSLASASPRPSSAPDCPRGCSPTWSCRTSRPRS